MSNVVCVQSKIRVFGVASEGHCVNGAKAILGGLGFQFLD